MELLNGSGVGAVKRPGSEEDAARFEYPAPTALEPVGHATYHVQSYFGYPFATGPSTDFVDNYQHVAATSFFPAGAYTLPYANGTALDPGGASSLLAVNPDTLQPSEFSGHSSSAASSPSGTEDGKDTSFYLHKTEHHLAGNSAFQPNLAFIQRSPFETFCTVPGRTSLLSSTTKYKVTVGEIQRRISPPECLNASLLGGILRKAKSKDGGKALRESLKRIGLALPAGRRKSANVTAWTALVEEEAVHMAKDFHSACERDFPAKEIGVFLCRNLATEEDAQRRRAMLHYVRLFIKELSDLMNSDRSPICGNRPDVILDPAIQKPLTHFSMVTHGFGGLALVAVLDALNSTVHESFKHIDRVFVPPPAVPIAQAPFLGPPTQLPPTLVQQGPPALFLGK